MKIDRKILSRFEDTKHFRSGREGVFYHRLARNHLKLNNLTTENCVFDLLTHTVSILTSDFDLLTRVNDILTVVGGFLAPEMFVIHCFEIVAAFSNGYDNL